MNLAGREVDLRRMNSAEEYARQAIAILQETGDDWGRAAAMANLSSALAATGRLNEARTVATHALEIMQAYRDGDACLRLMVVLAGIDFAAGKYLTAIELFQRVFDGSARLRPVRAAAQLGIGNAYLRLGLYDSAYDLAADAVRFNESLSDDRALASALELMRNVCGARSDENGAIVSTQRLIDVARRLGDPNLEAAGLVGLGTLLIGAGDLARAETHFEASEKLWESVSLSSVRFQILLGRGTLFAARGEIQPAECEFAAAAHFARTSGMTAEEAQALQRHGDALRLAGMPSKAEPYLRHAIAARETLSPADAAQDAINVSYNDVLRTSYCALAEVLADQGKYEQLLITSERGRARAFSDLVERRNAQGEVKAAAIDLSEIQQFAAETRATIVEYLLIPRQTCIVQFWAKFTELHILVVSPDGSVALRRVPVPDHAAWAHANKNSYQTQSARRLVPRNSGLSDLAEWHRFLIQPVRHLLPRNPDDTVIFVPDHFLFEAPFAAMRDETGKYLIEQHTIIVGPSIQVLLQVRRRRLDRAGRSPKQQSGNALRDGSARALELLPCVDQASLGCRASKSLVVGDPDGSLKCAATEALSIARMLNTRPLLGGEATKEAILSGAHDAGIIHLATHGVLHTVDGASMPGAVVAAPVGGERRFISSDELMALNLQADLIILSACSTGCGAVNADGVIGLSRALLGAGASSAIVALWDVPDDSTETLMRFFYSEYLTHGDKARALRQAMLALCSFQNPAAWAGFVLMGER